MPADVKAVTDKIAKITSEYYKSLGKVKNAKELAAAINKYSDQMEKLAPQIKAIEARYGSAEEGEDDDAGEDANAGGENFESAQEDWGRLMADNEMGAGFQKIQQYYSDPAVQKAMERLGRVMEKIGVSDKE
jgi:hypothetical protein